MNRPCPNKIECECSGSPIANLSSEGAEAAYWRQIGWCCDGTIKEYLSTVSYEDAVFGLQRTIMEECEGCAPAPPLMFMGTATCVDGTGTVVEYSPISQADADARAALAAATTPCDLVPDLPRGGGTMYGNQSQTAYVTCPDGTRFYYTVSAGMVYGRSQAEANAIALAYARRFASEKRICLGALPQECCVDEAFSEVLQATPVRRLNWQVYAGALPDGLTFDTGWNDEGRITISGTPTTAGNFTFTIIATDVDGSYMTNEFTIAVLEITDTELPAFTIGAAYSHQLTATGGDGDYTWSITEGNLPTGLTMSASGLISGTPTANDADEPITFEVTSL